METDETVPAKDSGETSFQALFADVAADVPVELQTVILQKWKKIRAELDESRPRAVGDPNRENFGTLQSCFNKVGQGILKGEVSLYH